MKSNNSKEIPGHIYKGQFCDRSPDIRPAGVIYAKPDDSVKKTLEWYTIEEHLEALKHDAGIYHETSECPPKPLKRNVRTRGLCTQISELLQPGDINTFEHLKTELKETAYASYWNKPLGRARDKVTDLPIGIDILKTTFGIKGTRDSIYDAIPRKTKEEIEEDSKVGHENYIKSHNGYWAEEQINRNYTGAFKKNNVFGKATHCDPNGKVTKKCLKWFNNQNLTVANIRQIEWERRNKPRIGKVLEPNNNASRVPPDYVFGVTSVADAYDVRSSINECSSFSLENEFKFCLKHINKVRTLLQKRFPKFNFRDLYDSMRYYDQKDKTGWLPKDIVYHVCNEYNVSFDRCKIENLLKYFKILQDDKYNIEKFVNILNKSVEFPYLSVMPAIPPEQQHYQTTTQASYRIDNTCDELNLPAAGIRTIRHEHVTPTIIEGGCKAYFEHLGAESTTRSAINPSIQTIYDVTHRDYLKYRPKEQIKNIFKSFLEMSDAHFDFLWAEAEKLDNGQVNVQMIRDLLKKYAKI
ncbi:EF-hand domain-containing family member B-like [Chrysoperla carnea]|uniref:EF-hand domain-containing family member B-like n=1 Tax=Chrysoperla carnea TaxID=189513 RepID=UPI001D07A76B|nr:EF-hand domain-containing family member B-like [Chrysoperla carnea]